MEFQNRNVGVPNRVKLIKLEGNLYELIEESGTVYEEGTKLTAEVMNEFWEKAGILYNLMWGYRKSWKFGS